MNEPAPAIDRSPKPGTPRALFETARERVMNAMFERSQKFPDGLIYHYCDANALLNIIKTKKVWSTQTIHLNDREELVALFKGMDGYLQGYRGVVQDYVRQYFLDPNNSESNFWKNGGSKSIPVACFSEDGDVLSQWRAYAANGKGFAIGFNARRLKCVHDGAMLTKMLYGDEISNIVGGFFSDICKSLEGLSSKVSSGSFTSNYSEPIEFGIRDFLYDFMFECKNSAFHEEREWRIRGGTGLMQYRVSREQLIMYQTLDMEIFDQTSSEEEKIMPVSEIVLGPCVSHDETERALSSLLAMHHYPAGSVRLRRSIAPYR
jgi:hypothetical protein